MAASHPRQQHNDRRSQAQRPHYLVTQGRWNESNPIGLRTGIVMVGIGLTVLVGGVLAILLNAPGYADVLLLFLSGSFLFYGIILLLLAPAAPIARRLRRIRSHCGRCRFYQPLDGQYALGHCRVDPKEALVQRTDGCPFFSYSKRAMVRDRFAQRARKSSEGRTFKQIKDN